MTNRPEYLLPLIVFSQFAGTSLWFAGNAILLDLQQQFGYSETALGNMTSAVQLGFIIGTLLFAFLLIADRFSPARVFMICALLGAGINLGIVAQPASEGLVLICRFATGLCLAGIYPVGMKIASDWYAADLGKALGYLVGALVLGTAFPHLVKFSAGDLSWQWVIILTSCLAGLGGLLVGLLLGDGPYRSKSRGFDAGVIRRMFRYATFRRAAFGYFGHMWELYAYWAFVPVLLESLIGEERWISGWSFAIIGIGGLGCVYGGLLSMRKGSQPVAFGMLLISGLLCLVSPVLIAMAPLTLLLPLLLLWGATVVGDSPQFSTLVARTAPAEFRGSALTIVNSIGFAITIFSIQLLNYLQSEVELMWLFLPLLPGPILGLLAIRGLKA